MRLAVLFLLILSVTIATQAKPHPAACRIYPLWKDGKVRSSYYDDLGRFTVTGEEGETVRSFTYDSQVITAGISFEYDYSKRRQRPSLVWISITVSDKPEKDLFESPNSSEAMTADRKGWNLQVMKSVRKGDVVGMFTLSCSQGTQLPNRR